MGMMLTGKVSLEYIHQIKYLIQKKYAVPSRHITDSFSENNNSNKTVDFILKSLK
jgi:hypothetical protein